MAKILIQTDNILSMLQGIALNDSLPPSQRLQASKILLDKSLPNMASVTPDQRGNLSEINNLPTNELHALLLSLEAAGRAEGCSAEPRGEGPSALSDSPFESSNKSVMQVGNGAALEGELIPISDCDPDNQTDAEFEDGLPW